MPTAATHDLDHYLQAYDAYLEAFIDTFSAFAKTDYNAPVAPGKWSPGQMVAHLLKSEQGTVRLLNGPAEPAPDDRTADAKCAAIEANFRVTTVAFTAPRGLSPEEGARYAPQAQLDEFVDVRADLRSAVAFAPDPGALVTSWAHPAFGTLTLTEWLYFTAIHGERHRLQVEAARRA